MGSYSANNTAQQLLVWTQTPAHRSTDNLESFLISRNYTEGLIVRCSPWKWNMLHRCLMVKDIACRSYIIERSWMSNQWEKTQHKQLNTSPQSSEERAPTSSQPAERNMCYVVNQSALRKYSIDSLLHWGALPAQNVFAISSDRLQSLQGPWGESVALFNFSPPNHVEIMCLDLQNTDQLRKKVEKKVELLMAKSLQLVVVSPPPPHPLFPAFTPQSPARR